MGSVGRVRIGHRAPDFHCDAVVKGKISEVTLSDYISDQKQRWLILLFIPAAFSFVCPGEVSAFEASLHKFHDRNCDVVFISVDTHHALWHWQNVPKQYGGLGQTDISLLSDPCHHMSNDYGVLMEEKGMCLRGMFILDDKAIVQHVTINNITVGRSVSEALRLLDAFQAVEKYGVLCPVNWHPSFTSTSALIGDISNTLTESYEERLANLQREFGQSTDAGLGAEHQAKDEEQNTSIGGIISSGSLAPTCTLSGFASLDSMQAQDKQGHNQKDQQEDGQEDKQEGEQEEKQEDKQDDKRQDQPKAPSPAPLPMVECRPHKPKESPQGSPNRSNTSTPSVGSKNDPSSRTPNRVLSRSTSLQLPRRISGSLPGAATKASTPSPTPSDMEQARSQMTFEAARKAGTGPASPETKMPLKLKGSVEDIESGSVKDFGSDGVEDSKSGSVEDAESEVNGKQADDEDLACFDVVVKGVEA